MTPWGTGEPQEREEAVLEHSEAQRGRLLCIQGNRGRTEFTVFRFIQCTPEITDVIPTVSLVKIFHYTSSLL